MFSLLWPTDYYLSMGLTAEEVAKDYVTKVELTISIDRVIDRLDKLDEKMDKLITG